MVKVAVVCTNDCGKEGEQEKRGKQAGGPGHPMFYEVMGTSRRLARFPTFQVLSSVGKNCCSKLVQYSKNKLKVTQYGMGLWSVDREDLINV